MAAMNTKTCHGWLVGKPLPILALLGCFALSALADPAPGVKTVLELKPGPDNPRNSEGAFMPLKDGRIMFAYSRYYGKSSSDHAAADIAARYSSDKGATWTDKDEIIVKNHGRMNVMSVSLLRLQSGEIALFYLQKNSTSDCRPVMRRSFDEGRTWSEPAMCITDEVGYFVLNNDRVIQLRDGRLLFAVSLHSFPDGKFDNKGVVMTYFSDDNGKTWRRGRSRLEVVAPDGKRRAAQEPGVVECRDGSVLLWIRTNAGCQYMCRSADRGETLAAPTPIGASPEMTPERVSLRLLPAAANPMASPAVSPACIGAEMVAAPAPVDLTVPPHSTVIFSLPESVTAEEDENVSPATWSPATSLVNVPPVRTRACRRSAATDALPRRRPTTRQRGCRLHRRSM